MVGVDVRRRYAGRARWRDALMTLSVLSAVAADSAPRVSRELGRRAPAK